MLSVVIGVANVKPRRARAVNPLIEELLLIDVICLFNSSDKIRRDHILAAIDLQVAPQAAIESILANLVAKHVQHQAALSISVAVKLAGVVKIVPHGRLAV